MPLQIGLIYDRANFASATYNVDVKTRNLDYIRGYNDYISKYRRVIEYIDAVNIGLTATPALHAVEIFGRPVYAYSYYDAVIDGYL